MRVALIGFIIFLAACKPTETQQTAYPDFPKHIRHGYYAPLDTLEVRFGNDLNSGFNITLPDSLMMQIFDSLSDKIKEQFIISDSIKHSKTHFKTI